MDKTASEKRYIEFDGYDDSLFGKTDTLEVETHNYLDGFRESKGYVTEPYDKDKYIVTKKDTTAIYVSKMYFDTTVMAFYKDERRRQEVHCSSQCGGAFAEEVCPAHRKYDDLLLEKR